MSNFSGKRMPPKRRNAKRSRPDLLGGAVLRASSMACWCRRCDEREAKALKLKFFVEGRVLPPIPPCITVLRINYCKHCGFKRCPCATDHRLACGNSDAPGQPGSHYEVANAVKSATPSTSPSASRETNV